MGAPPLSTFLSTAKSSLVAARTSKSQTTLVLGNEHPDIDSIASAVLFAYFRTAAPPEGAWSQQYIPALNERRSALSHQALLARVLPHANIQFEDLIALEDLVTQGTQSGLHEDFTRLFFVDHNLTLGREKQNYSHRVIGCIDHNADENYVPKDTAPEPRIIFEAGSCTSLVINFVRSTWEALEFDTASIDVSLAKLGLAAILVDTKDLNENVTEEDVKAVEFLISRIKISSEEKEFDRTGYYYEIIGEERPQPEVERVMHGPELPPDYFDEPVAEPIVEEPAATVLPEPEPQPEEIPVVQEEAIVEPEPEVPLEPVEEVKEEPVILPEEQPIVADPVIEPTPQPEPAPEPISEPQPEAAPIIEPVFIDTSPAAQAQPEPLQEEEAPPRAATPPRPATPEQPITPPIEPVTPLSPVVTNSYRRVYLDEVLAHDFELGYEGGGAIGISFTRMPLSEMFLHAEKDVTARAEEDAASPPTSPLSPNGNDVKKSPPPPRKIKGTPFTTAVRHFALERGLSVYAICTATRHGNELFIYVSKRSMAYYIPRFVQNQAFELGLERWGTDADEINGLSGMRDGMMGAYWMKRDKGRDEVKSAVLSGTTYVFFGSQPTSPMELSRVNTRDGLSRVSTRDGLSPVVSREMGLGMGSLNGEGVVI